MIAVPMQRARKHSDISLKKDDREHLKTHFKECSIVVKKQEVIMKEKIKTNKQKTSLTPSDIAVIQKVIANTAFYQLLISKLGENYAQTSLNFIRYDSFYEGDIILSEGDVSKKTFYILQGSVRSWKSQGKYSAVAGELPPGWDDESSMSKREFIMGSSFGYLPNEIQISSASFQASSSIVELAYIDQFGIGFIDKEIVSISTQEKLDFLKKRFPEVFFKIAKPACLLFVPLIEQILVGKGEAVAHKFPLKERRVCILSKGQLIRETKVEMERERLQDNGIDISEVRQLTMRSFDTKIISKGQTILVGSTDNNMNQSTHLRVSDVVVSSKKDSRLYYYNGTKYEDILDDLRYQMRYDAFMNTDNLKVSTKVFEDFILLRQRFLNALNNTLPPNQREKNPAPPPSNGLKSSMSPGGTRIYSPKSVLFNPGQVPPMEEVTIKEEKVEVIKKEKQRLKTTSPESVTRSRNTSIILSQASTIATARRQGDSRQTITNDRNLGPPNSRHERRTASYGSILSGSMNTTINHLLSNQTTVPQMPLEAQMKPVKWHLHLAKYKKNKLSLPQNCILQIFDGMSIQSMKKAVQNSQKLVEEDNKSDIENFTPLYTQIDYYRPKYGTNSTKNIPKLLF